MAVKTQLEMTGPLCLELAHLAPSLVPCSVCSPCQFGYPRKNDVRSWGRRESEGHANRTQFKVTKNADMYLLYFLQMSPQFSRMTKGTKGFNGKEEWTDR
jgi:hypothetical protein